MNWHPFTRENFERRMEVQRLRFDSIEDQIEELRHKLNPNRFDFLDADETED